MMRKLKSMDFKLFDKTKKRRPQNERRHLETFNLHVKRQKSAEKAPLVCRFCRFSRLFGVANDFHHFGHAVGVACHFGGGVGLVVGE